MNTDNLIKTILKGKNTILLVIVISLLFGIGFEKLRPLQWSMTLPLVISPSGEAPSGEFNYDHYYSLEAIDSMTDSLEEWLKTQGVRETVQAKTKSNFQSATWRWWETNNWSIRKKAPQLIEVGFTTGSEQDAKNLEKSLKEQVGNYLNSYNQSGNPYFNLTNSTSALEFATPHWGYIIFLCFIWGAILGIILVLELENLRKREK